ncbi:AraC family transcriptional regulator [Pseudozobellia thermophila]|uniref:AraC-type DNA-binding protein n=1 Tax=Pseudozobellia thermophila TaxID=192903 RepID=A0A1M6NXL6_9FLAO|nr:AraC family transcriptional regulator [Pseudozobellia thermophila]SHK00381.1 AraC-type DNA-binding protein [Pseudozobellia thermophila]
MSTPSIEKTLTSKETFVFKDLVGPHFNPIWHFHPEFQISYIAEGEGTRFVGDHVHNFTVGDLVLTGPNLPHLWRSDAPYFEPDSTLNTRGLVIYFDHDLLSGSLLEREEFYTINKLIENAYRGIEFYGDTPGQIYKLLLEIADERGFKRIIKLLEILDILANSKEYTLLASPSYTNSFKGGDSEKMSMVYDYVMSNFKNRISLDEVAGMLNMTTSSFCRYFKPRANKTFTRFVNEIRIGHARKLLLEDNFNISQISYECGFNALSNFNRQFKAITELSPHEYRQMFLEIQSHDG